MVDINGALSSMMNGDLSSTTMTEFNEQTAPNTQLDERVGSPEVDTTFQHC